MTLLAGELILFAPWTVSASDDQVLIVDGSLGQLPRPTRRAGDVKTGLTAVPPRLHGSVPPPPEVPSVDRDEHGRHGDQSPLARQRGVSAPYPLVGNREPPTGLGALAREPKAKHADREQ